MVPCLCHCTINGKYLKDFMPKEWYPEMMKTVRERGGKVIAARGGKSSAASAAEAALNHIKDWHLGTTDIVSVSIPAPKDNIYGVPEGIVFSFPCKSYMGEWYIQKLEVCEELKPELTMTIKDLVDERHEALGI